MKIFNRNLLWMSVLAAVTQHNAIAGSTAMVSVNAQQIVGNSSSNDASLSNGGAAIAFESDATNFALGDGNFARDVFLKSGGKILTRISVNSLGQEGKNNAADWWDTNNYADSENPSISIDGKLVVFQSNANNLDLLTQDNNNDTANNKETDIFLRDVAKKKTYRLSGIMDGADGVITTVPAPLLDKNNQPLTKADAPWKIIEEANDASTNPVIAGTLKAGVVAFESKATNLIPSIATSGKKNIYVVDLKTKKIELISAVHDTTGAPTAQAQNATPAAVDSTNPALSPDGRFVAFQSTATNLSGVTGTKTDVFLYDRLTYRMYQLSGALSASAPFSVVVEGNDDSANASITGGGKSKSYLIAFDSKATNQGLASVPINDSGSDSDVFVAEFKPGTSTVSTDPLSAGEILSVQRISGPVDTNSDVGEAVNGDGSQKAESTLPVIAGSATAFTVAFRSTADNLLTDTLGIFWNEDSNKAADIYVYDSKTRLFSRANVDSGGEQGEYSISAERPSLSPDGKAVGFDTKDDYLVPFFGDNGNSQVYLRKR